jgi:creatinine amidohydrolase
MLLALDPDRVQMRRAVQGDIRPLTQTLPLLRAGGVRGVTATGVLGDPTGANPIEGEALLDELAAALIRDVEAWRLGNKAAVGTVGP